MRLFQFIGVGLGLLIVAAGFVLVRHYYRAGLEAEASIAAIQEEMFRDLSSTVLQPDMNSLALTPRIIELLTLAVDPSWDRQLVTAASRQKVADARSSFVSNLVAWLEYRSGTNYGTNVSAWEDWWQAQGPEAEQEKECR
jgi:hypothetical protein